MVASEREMVEKFPDPVPEQKERLTSLQATYEDSVPADDAFDWDEDVTR